MDRRFLIKIYLTTYFIAMITTVFPHSETVKRCLGILEECKQENRYIPNLLNQRLRLFFSQNSIEELINILLEVERIDNLFLINALTAIIIDRIGDNDQELLLKIKNRVQPQTYDYLIKHANIKTQNSTYRACKPGLEELSIAEYISLYDLPLEYLGNVGILRFDNKNINSLYGIQNISLPDVGIVILTNNCISGDRLDPQFPEDPFKGLSNISTLLINRNIIESLPTTFFQSAPFIREVNLAVNNLESIPKAFTRNNNQLGFLRLSNNKISNIPPEDTINAPILEALQLDNNRISNLPDKFFATIPNLNNLLMQNNRLVSWPGSMSDSLVEVIYLDLSNNSITNFDPDFIAPGTEIVLTGNPLTTSQIEIIQKEYPEAYIVF